MRLDQLVANLFAATQMYRSVGDSYDKAIKKALVSSLAHQIRKDVDGIPDSLVDSVEYVAREYMGATKTLNAIETTLSDEPTLSGQELAEVKNKLIDPGIGVTSAEIENDITLVKENVGAQYSKLHALQNSVLKRL